MSHDVIIRGGEIVDGTGRVGIALARSCRIDLAVSRAASSEGGIGERGQGTGPRLRKESNTGDA